MIIFFIGTIFFLTKMNYELQIKLKFKKIVKMIFILKN